MKKVNFLWSIRELLEKFDLIEFPEFQREPTVWNLEKKRKLIDSILRQFDIASIYLFKREDGYYECIDGRQRINAIISFLGLNESNQQDLFAGSLDNSFTFISSDELLGTKDLEKFTNKKWEKFTEEEKEQFLSYRFNVLELSDIDKNEELNLMFLRLQLGEHLNGGEKLNAMLGDMRDFIFRTAKSSDFLGNHKYFEFLNIPKRRFSKELTAAQISINYFSLYKKKEYRRARFVDLQEFFKDYLVFNADDKKIADLLRTRLDLVFDSVKNVKGLNLNNRAIGISTFFYINQLIESNRSKQIPIFSEFLGIFLNRLKNQVERGIDIDQHYRDLLKFQTYISQAAVEKYAIENRQKFLDEYFRYYLDNKKIIGDD